MNRLLVAPFGMIDGELVLILSERLHQLFRVEIVNELPPFNPHQTFNSERNQYHSTELLKLLLRTMSGGGDKILGITGFDLYVPILTFVFGEAQLGGTSAVVSSFRLRNEYYGLPADNGLLEDRLVKESVHELGHTFGLIHCKIPECVMHASTYAEEIDFKTSQFCPSCFDAVQKRWEAIPPHTLAVNE